jgi:hypothetical protein
MADMEMDEEKQVVEWDVLYDRLIAVLAPFGKDDPFGEGEYWILDDNYGHPQHKVYFNKLEMLEPRIVKAIQAVVGEFPGWDIVVAMDVQSAERGWPEMGLIIRKDEIIDGLQRQYFPPEYRNFEYEGSRRGTDQD